MSFIRNSVQEYIIAYIKQVDKTHVIETVISK